MLNRFTNGPFIFRFATSLFYHLDLFSSRDFFKFFKRNYSIILSTNISFVKYFLKFFVSSFYLPETNFYIIPSLSFLVKPFFKRNYSIILSTNISFVKYFLKFFVSSFYLPETNFYIIPSLSFLVKPFFLKSFLTHPLLLKRTFI